MIKHNISVKCAPKVISVLATLFAVLSLYIPMTVHAENCSVAFGSASYEHDNGENFQLGVYIKSDYGAASYSVIVRYDTNYIRYVSGADAVGTATGAIQLLGTGAQNSIQRMLTFQAVNAGEFRVYAESADVYFFPLTQTVDAAGNILVVPSATPVRYNVAGLASAPVTIKANEDNTTDQQTDTENDTDTNAGGNTDEGTDQTTQPDDNNAEVVSDVQTDAQEDGPALVSDNNTVSEADTDNVANDIWQTPSVIPAEQTEKKSVFSSGAYLVIIFAIIIIVAWIDIAFFLSHKSESARRRRVLKAMEEEEKEELEESSLRFADIDEIDEAENSKPARLNYKFKTLPSDGPTSSLNYEDIDGMTDIDDPEDPMD